MLNILAYKLVYLSLLPRFIAPTDTQLLMEQNFDKRLLGVWMIYKRVTDRNTIEDAGNMWKFNPDGTAEHAYRFNAEWVKDDKPKRFYLKNGITWIEDETYFKSIVKVVSDDEIYISGEKSIIKSYYKRKK